MAPQTKYPEPVKNPTTLPKVTILPNEAKTLEAPPPKPKGGK